MPLLLSIIFTAISWLKVNAWVWLGSLEEIAAAFFALVSRLTCRGSITAVSGARRLVSFAPRLLKVLLSQSLSNGHPPKGKRIIPLAGLNIMSSDYTATGRVARGRVVITGGGGNIGKLPATSESCIANKTGLGKYITQRLLASSTPVTIVDHIFYPDELRPSDVASNPLLTVHIGDIRNTTLLSSVFTSDVVGVVHLASISRVLQCEENPRDCTNVNKRGTQLVLDSLEHLNRQDQGKRWFVLASSIEIYGDATTSTLREDAPTNPSSFFGVSKLAAETTVETRIRNMESSSGVGTLHAVSLRLSHVYGGLYDHNDRLIPSIATQALWNLVIQVSGGWQTVRVSQSPWQNWNINVVLA